MAADVVTQEVRAITLDDFSMEKLSERENPTID